MSFFMTPQQVYEQLTGGPGSGTLSEAQGISYDASAREQARADKSRRIGTKIQGGWQGSAADGAYGAAQPQATAVSRSFR